MRPSVPRALMGALLIVAVALPASSAQAQDYVASPNIEHIRNIKTVGDGVGGRIVDGKLYVTSTKSLSIWDIMTDPGNPRQLGSFTLDVEWENEEVPTNGKILGMSAEIGCKDPLGVLAGQPSVPMDDLDGASHCINLYDVSDPENVTFLKSVVGAGNHTSTCVFDCQYMWGDNGPITDIRDPKNAKIVGNWLTASKAKTSCHHVREIAPGIVFGSCQPIVLLSARPEHGGSPLKPVVLSMAKNADNRFIHSNRWPRQGRDKFAIIGGETNAPAVLGESESYQCDDKVAAMMVWDTLPALNPDGSFKQGGTFNMLDEQRPRNGTYADGRSPYNALGCSVHWFTEHPEFQNGGVVAIAEYENGTRIKQVQTNGKIVEQGYFLPLGGSTSAPHFHPDGQHIYAIDYARGIDVLKYTGPSYRGGPDPFNPGPPTIEPGRTPGTDGKIDQKAVDELKQREAQMERNCSPYALAATARRAGRGLRLGAGGAAFTAQVFQLSSGRSIITKRRVARLSGASGEKTWKGRTPGKKMVKDGFYLVRITTGGKTRQLVFERRKGKFIARRDFQTGSSCAVIRSFQLRSPVFGGRKNVAAAVSFRLTQDMATVYVDVMRGRKVVKRATHRKVLAHKTYKVTVPARGVRRGPVTVRLTAVRGGRPVQIETLNAARL